MTGRQPKIFNLLLFFPRLAWSGNIATFNKGKYYLRYVINGKIILTDMPRNSIKECKSVIETKFKDIMKAQICENPDEKSKCPVEAKNLYLERINDTEHLFPKPSINRKEIQYGIRQANCSEANFMSNLSTKLGLSWLYTNQCTRVPLVTMLKEQMRMCVELIHKNPTSIDRYNRR